VAIAATIVQVGWSWARHRKVDNMLWRASPSSWYSAEHALAARRHLHQVETDGAILAFRLHLLGSELFFRKNLIRAMMDSRSPFRPGVAEAEPELDRIFRADGAANLYVAFPFAESFCASEVSAKAPVRTTSGSISSYSRIGLMLVFVVAQGLMLSRHIESQERN